MKLTHAIVIIAAQAIFVTTSPRPRGGNVPSPYGQRPRASWRRQLLGLLLKDGSQHILAETNG
ncbi:hypothetical protein PG997_014170 [Apiospora hydei]|uniref:Uncharacterized protein n=1 Tax=Apiospora hydei TaxID=1337664 RepID=A0ABR1UW68_9PEZI